MSIKDYLIPKFATCKVKFQEVKPGGYIHLTMMSTKNVEYAICSAVLIFVNYGARKSCRLQILN